MSEQQKSAEPKSEVQKSAGTGLQPNVAGLLCYLVGWVTGIIFLIIEKDNNFVRFHALQSIAVFGAITVADIIVNIVFGMIPLIGWAVSLIVMWLIGVFAVIVWIVLMMKAYQGKMFKLPIAGDFAEKNSKVAAK